MDIRELKALQGIELRSPFGPVRARLGAPDTAERVREIELQAPMGA